MILGVTSVEVGQPAVLGGPVPMWSPRQGGSLDQEAENKAATRDGSKLQKASVRSVRKGRRFAWSERAALNLPISAVYDSTLSPSHPPPAHCSRKSR